MRVIGMLGTWRLPKREAAYRDNLGRPIIPVVVRQWLQTQIELEIEESTTSQLLHFHEKGIYQLGTCGVQLVHLAIECIQYIQQFQIQTALHIKGISTERVEAEKAEGDDSYFHGVFRLTELEN